jgi:RNA polymerase-binding transcription factor DksA
MGYTAGRFCSNACKSMSRRASGVDNETRTCEQCGAEFTIDRYKATVTCSMSCAAKMRWVQRRSP